MISSIINKEKEMSHIQKLEELITQGVIPDIDARLDEIFEEIVDEKDASDEAKEEIEELREFKADLQDLLDEIQAGEVSEEEAEEIVADILEAQSGEGDEEE